MDSESLISGLTVTNLIINSIMTVMLYNILLDSQHDKFSVRNSIWFTAHSIAVGFITGATIFAVMLTKYYVIGHIVCVCNVVIINSIIDLTFNKLVPVKIQDVYVCNYQVTSWLKALRIGIFCAWLMVLLYCILVEDLAGRVSGAKQRPGIHGLLIIGDMQAMITVGLPNFILLLLVLRLYIKTFESSRKHIRWLMDEAITNI